MIYQDRVYGQIKIEKPLILELINHPLMQRLKGVNQSGYYEPFLSKESYSRFEHSVGVYILLKKFDAPFREQVAGLIHDFSHSVFSHCIDYVFSNYILSSDLPIIFKKYHLDIKFLLDEKNFPLKEKDLPDLCADRIDYTLRN